MICKQRLVIVLTLHIECNFNLKVFFFSFPHSPPFIINHLETVNCCNFLSVSTFVGDFGGENCDGTDFKMGVAATLPELSEWTLLEMSFETSGQMVLKILVLVYGVLLYLKPVRVQCYRITHVHNCYIFRSMTILWKILYFISFGHIQLDFVRYLIWICLKSELR